MILAKTYKGYGIKEVQDKLGYHGKPFAKEELGKILDELKSNFKKDAEFQEAGAWEPEKPTLSTSGGSRSKTQDEITIPNPEYKFGEQISTRKAYGQALAQLGKVCEEVVSLDGDVKKSFQSDFFNALLLNKIWLAWQLV